MQGILTQVLLKLFFIPAKAATSMVMAIALITGMGACVAGDEQTGESLNISQAWIPETPPGAKVMAGYMRISNPQSKAIQILTVESPAFESVEMHLSQEINGLARMLPQKQLDIAAKGSLELKPGSYHLMLIKPLKRLKDGDHVELTMQLSDNSKQSLTIPVKKPSMNPPYNNSRPMKCAAGKCGGGKCGGG